MANSLLRRRQWLKASLQAPVAWSAGAAALSGCLTGWKPSVAKDRLSRPAPRPEELLAAMSLDEKLGQMTQADVKALRMHENDIADLGLGSVLNGGDSLPRPNTPEAWADQYDRVQARALNSRLGIPLIVGTDAVHGHALVKGAVAFPHNIGLGAAGDAALVQEVARITAKEVAGTGIDWIFGPCVAVARDERWGRTYESYSEDPALVAKLGAAVVKGFQGNDLSAASAVLACAKHFLGDGGTTAGVDQGNAQVSEEELRQVHLPGYIEAIKAGVGSVMISYSKWNGTPMHINADLITGLLKGELGFTGFVVTDWEAIDRMGLPYDKAVALSLNAGVDMVMAPNRYRRFIEVARALVKAKQVPVSRIDDAVLRILRQKQALGLWQRPMVDRSLTRDVGSAAHRAVGRKAVQASLVVLKNEGVLPLQRKARILVAGRKADDVGAQCGGWTVSWQGRKGAVTPGTSILAGLQAVAGTGHKVAFSADGEGGEKADVIVAVVGEEPYAEGRGDRKNLSLRKDDKALLEKLRQSGKPMVVVLISGRPLIFDNVIEDAQAVVAAWLPGTEGAGVADVLFGDVAATGKLPFTWPANMDQIPINAGDAKAEPLFPLGFGLA